MKDHRLSGGMVGSEQVTIVEGFSHMFSSHPLALAEAQQKEKPEGNETQQPFETPSSSN